MAKVDLSLSEAKSKVDLVLETKKTTKAWGETGTEVWPTAYKTWGQPSEFSTRETKVKVDLSLEAK